jgi:hypothetical protein
MWLPWTRTRKRDFVIDLIDSLQVNEKSVATE